MTLAYLTNQYPKVSHTFIRREIRALEALGRRVLRYSIRGTPDELRDADDLRERDRTTVVLDRGALELGRASSHVAATRPDRFARAARLALSVGLRSERGPAVHGAYLAEACWLRLELERRGVTHLHVHFGTNPATVAMLCRELGGPPFSFTVHGPEEFDKAPLIALAEKIRRANFVVAVSSYGRSQLCRLARFEDWGKIHVIGCGVDDRFLDAPVDPVPAEPRLVCIGRLSEQKGQLVLVQAAAALRERIDRFQIVLVGDGEMREELTRHIEALGLRDRVRITGWLDGPAVQRELVAARALVLPSFAEGLPVAIMEALALGRPVVSTYIAGIPELVEPGRSGWLVPAGSVSALAQALFEVLSADPAVLSEMGLTGRGSVRARHDARTNALVLSKLFGAEPPRAPADPRAAPRPGSAP